MKRFIYTDNKNKVSLCQCMCETIEEADSLYKQEYGIHPSKQPHVGCQIKPLVEVEA